MASYQELYRLASDGALLAKVTTAVAVAAEAIRGEDVGTANHANRLIWAARALQSPAAEAARMIWAVLAQNKSITVAQFAAAADADVQTAVNNTVNLFATGA